MNEQQFLGLSDRERAVFIAMNVFGFQWVAWKKEKHDEYNAKLEEPLPNTKWLQYLDPKHEWHIEPTEEDLPLNEKPYRCVPEYHSWNG